MDDITDVSGLVTAGTEFRVSQGMNVWWRGEPTSFPMPLVPSMLRVPRAPHEEASILGHFKQRAHSRSTGLPEASNLSAWLFLMQHHGLPTRLLDWTGSALAGLFFAAEAMPTTDGFLWGICPAGLNHAQSGVRRLALPNNDEVQGIIEAAFGAEGESNAIIAVLPAESDLRMLLQQGRYTIHGTPGDLAAMAEEVPYLVKFRVPAAAKETLMRQLEMLGISRSQLFPDLASLALDVAAMNLGDPPQEGSDPTELGSDDSGAG